MERSINPTMPTSEESVRRTPTKAATHAVKSPPSNSMEFGCYKFLPDLRSVSYDGQEARLQPIEYRLALLLFNHAGTPLTREMIFKSVWTKQVRNPAARTIDVHIVGLRRKLALAEGRAATIRCIHGFGYMLVMKKKTKARS